MRGFAQILTASSWMSIQDGGRKGLMHLGVPISGFMDCEKAHLANEMLKNDVDVACLEIFGDGCSIRFSQPATFSMASDGAHLCINAQKVASGCCITAVNRGDIISLKNNPSWSYIAIEKGWQSPVVLGSKSMMKGITPRAMIQKGHVLSYESGPFQNLLVQWNHEFVVRRSFKVIPGPEFYCLDIPPSKIELKISPQSGRHATILEHQTVLKGGEISSGLTMPGTLQLTPDGTMYMLNRDAQTTGGYYRIGFLYAADIDEFNRIKVWESILFDFDQTI